MSAVWTFEDALAHATGEMRYLAQSETMKGIEAGFDYHALMRIIETEQVVDEFFAALFTALDVLAALVDVLVEQEEDIDVFRERLEQGLERLS